MARSKPNLLESAALIGILLVSGCAFHVPLATRIPDRSGMEKSGARVELVAPSSLAERTYDATGMFWIGIAHTWKFQIGKEVVGSSKEIYQQFFEQVDVSQSRTIDDEAYLLVIVPEIQEFEVSSISMRTEVLLRYQISDSSGHLIHESSVEGRSSFGGPQWVGVFLGVLGGKYALSDSASDALDEAYANLIEDLENAQQAGLLEPPADRTDDPAGDSAPRDVPLPRDPSTSPGVRGRPVSLP